MVTTPSDLLHRDVIVDDEYCNWWYCSTSAFIVKWVIVGVILLIFIGWFFGGYLHAKRRMRKGLQPLAYHRFLVSRRQREIYFPQQLPQNNVAFYNPETGRYGPPLGQGYPMQPWVAPPPAYGDQGYVPPYPGAPGASKVNPDQNLTNSESVYDAPPGPPPPQPPTQAATTIRELGDTDHGRDTNGLRSPGLYAGPSRSLQPTVEQAK